MVWAAGFAVPPLAGAAGLATDARGRMVVDGAPRSASHPDVFGASDAVAAPAVGGETRMSCQTGVPMGAAVAGAVAARAAGRAPRPVRFRYVGQNISLGRRDAVIQFTRSDDTAVAAALTGRAAVAVKEAVVRGAFWAARWRGGTVRRVRPGSGR
ncbi:hypothetical protein J4709_12220 [Actinomadura sp. LCR2-06]|uniref:Uncharacterized protein n=1 Tax=Actinomadura violacea TaxID=2819934 RepID=A0ABS3RPU6_9ACTN|nr:hypothetical protein [Actinomadura violacea]